MGPFVESGDMTLTLIRDKPSLPVQASMLYWCYASTPSVLMFCLHVKGIQL